MHNNSVVAVADPNDHHLRCDASEGTIRHAATGGTRGTTEAHPKFKRPNHEEAMSVRSTGIESLSAALGDLVTY